METLRTPLHLKEEEKAHSCRVSRKTERIFARCPGHGGLEPSISLVLQNYGSSGSNIRFHLVV